MYKITLSDGTKLENLELNGNNFIAPGIIDDSVFTDNLANVVIEDGSTAKTYSNMVLVSNREDGGKSWFILREKTHEEEAEEERSRIIAEIQQQLASLSTTLEVNLLSLDQEYQKGVNSL